MDEENLLMSKRWFETKERPPRMEDFATKEDIELNKHTNGLIGEVYISYMSKEEYIQNFGEIFVPFSEAEVTIPFNGPIKWRTSWLSDPIAEPTFWRIK